MYDEKKNNLTNFDSVKEIVSQDNRLLQSVYIILI